MLNTTNANIEQIFFEQIKAVTLKTQFKERKELSNRDLRAIENAKRIKVAIMQQIK